MSLKGNLLRRFTLGASLKDLIMIAALITSCSEGSFSGDSDRQGIIKKPTKPTTPETPVPPTNNTPPSDDSTIITDDGGQQWEPCTKQLSVPGKANPYLAGMPAGTSITYMWAARPDAVGSESPVQLVPEKPDCLKEGESITFNISGRISHGGSKATNADGKQNDVKFHQKNGILGKSSIRAPLNSMVGVFLGDGVPNGSPATMDFHSASSRDYAKLTPGVGQIFFIGDGKRSNGALQEIVVPAGAKRLFLGIMDGYEWSNNSGQLSGGFSTKKK
jgi:hypothetical protein